MPYRKPVITSDWMRIAEAAARLDCHPNTIRNRINSGKITGVRVARLDGVVRLHRADWERYLKRSTVDTMQAA
jgi:excisionase family DNA binding protein